MTSNFTVNRRSSSRPVVWRLPPLLKPLRSALNNIEITDRRWAHWICRTIPCQCPFERDVALLGHHLLHVPSLCKLNPLYEEVLALRFRALCYLAEDCQEDITCYIS